MLKTFVVCVMSWYHNIPNSDLKRYQDIGIIRIVVMNMIVIVSRAKPQQLY
jgi:hypothetical protein